MKVLKNRLVAFAALAGLLFGVSAGASSGLTTFDCVALSSTISTSAYTGTDGTHYIGYSTVTNCSEGAVGCCWLEYWYILKWSPAMNDWVRVYQNTIYKSGDCGAANYRLENHVVGSGIYWWTVEVDDCNGNYINTASDTHTF